MMTEQEVLNAFLETEALLEGHFELRSKLHSNRYFQCANVLRYPRVAGKLCDALVEKMLAAKTAGKIDGVISPAVGGILVGHEVARALDTVCVFAEKVVIPNEFDAAGKPVTKLEMRRFALKPGARYVVAEDVITRGGRVQETIDLVKAAGAEVAAVLVLVDRSQGKAKFDYPTFSLMEMSPTVWEPSECPMCAKGDKPVHPGS
ncbi:MAG: orotate phosphoribosyltransferase [Kiritimatiellae bacterium]|nr:orotate phosphoribosyltransferase [Kiritimatiellia bacterium]